ncbi:MAG: HAD family hydrolase [Velocimicrobium sp.]
MIKLVCTDIDGTLVPDGTDKLNPELFEVIQKLKEKGIMFAAASGRQYGSMQALFAEVANDMIFIAEGGNLVMCRDEVMAISQMDKDTVQQLVEDIEKIEGCNALLCGPERGYARQNATELIRLLTEGYHYNMQIVEEFESILDHEIIKVSLFHSGGKADELARDYLFPKWESGRGIELVCAGTHWMDCIKLGSNKGTAIEQIQSIMNIEPAETMVFGDNINDIHMLLRADYSYAVGNARDEVKEVAKYVADTNVNDGVLKELKKLLIQLDRQEG